MYIMLSHNFGKIQTITVNFHFFFRKIANSKKHRYLTGAVVSYWI